MKSKVLKKVGNNTAKVLFGAGILLLPDLALAAGGGGGGNQGGDAVTKVREIGSIVLNILIAVVGIWLTIMLITRAMKIMQGEMSARELVPPIAGGVVAFLAYYLAKVILSGMEARADF